MKKLLTCAILGVAVPAMAQTTPPQLPSAPEVVPNGGDSANSGVGTKQINEDECAIWLCLPGGFPEGCGKAHSAMTKRLKKGKSPLPSFSSCSADGNDHGLAHHQTTAYKIEAHDVCTDGNAEKIAGNKLIRKMRFTCNKFQRIEEHWGSEAECKSVGRQYCDKIGDVVRITQHGKEIGVGVLSQSSLSSQVSSEASRFEWKVDGKFRRPVGGDQTVWEFIASGWQVGV